jgi:hypothetical protein
MKNSVASPTHNVDEGLLEQIVNALRPWKQGFSKLRVPVSVRHEIEVLSKTAPLVEELTDRRAMKTHAKKLDKARREFETLLTSSPGPLWGSLFSEGASDRMSIQDHVGRLARVNSFFNQLKRIGEVCDRAIKNGFGFHPNKDFCQVMCARSAYVLMQKLSNATISSSSPESKFRVITGLLYQAVSGSDAPPDLERACDAELRGWKKIGLERSPDKRRTDPGQ